MGDPHRLNATVEPSDEGLRVDRYLAESLELFPRSQIAHRAVSVRINGAPAKLSRRLKTGDVLSITYQDPQPASIEPEPVPLSVIFESDDAIVIDKPAGMVVHPAAGNWSGTLAQGLMYRLAGMAEEFGGGARPGIVHRLDKDTSGVIIAAKHPGALASLAAQFKARTTEKLYLAIARGRVPANRGTVDAAIGRDPGRRQRFAVKEKGKPAVTHYRVLKRYGEYSFLVLRPETGRTHQLRVHLASLGCPIAGDPIYARNDSFIGGLGMMLHAYRLRITLPGESVARTFTARLPRRFRRALELIAERYGSSFRS